MVLLLDLMYDLDESVTLKSKRLALRLLMQNGLHPVLLLSLIPFIIFIASITVLMTSLALQDYGTLGGIALTKRLLFHGINLFYILVGVRILEELYRAAHRRIDADNALSTEKSHGDGYKAWAYVSAGLCVATLAFFLLPGLEILFGVLVSGYPFCSAYGEFLTRNGTNKPRKRRKVRTKIAESIRERLAGRQLAPHPM